MSRFVRRLPLRCWSCHCVNVRPKIVEKLAYHALPNNIHSETERQKCLFHVANLMINQTQAFWVAFLRPGMADRGAIEPVAVHSPATVGLLDFYGNPNSGYHWDAEFFGGLVIMRHNRDNPSTRLNQHGGFGRTLSVGDPYLDRADGTEQRIAMHSITRCLNRGKHKSRPERTHQRERGIVQLDDNMQISLTQKNRLRRRPAEWSARARGQSSCVWVPIPRLFGQKKTGAALTPFYNKVIPILIKLHVVYKLTQFLLPADFSFGTTILSCYHGFHRQKLSVKSGIATRKFTTDTAEGKFLNTEEVESTGKLRGKNRG